MSMDDGQIVGLYWKRSENAISETANKYGRYCYYIAYNILRNNEDSEECVNDTYMKAWNAMPPQCPKCLSTFLGKITRNLSLNLFHHNNAAKRNPGQYIYALEEFAECVSYQSGAEEVENRDVIISTFNRFLEQLSKRDRKVFVRRYWYFSSIAEIAKEYGLSEENVKVILLRSRKKLKIILEEEGIYV